MKKSAQLPPKNCQSCLEPFVPRQKNQRFCGKTTCRTSSWKLKNRDRLDAHRRATRKLRRLEEEKIRATERQSFLAACAVAGPALGVGLQ